MRAPTTDPGSTDGFAPVGVEERYPPPAAWVDPDRSKPWFRRMLPVVRAHKALFAGALAATVIAVLAQVAIPRLVMAGIDALETPGRTVGGFVAVIVVLGLARGGFGFVSRYGMFRTAYAIEYDLRNMLYEHLSRLSFSFYDRVQSGQLISRANSDIRAVQLFLAFAPMMAVTVLSFAVALVLMIQISPVLALLAVLPLPGVYWYGVKMRRLIFPVSWVVQARLADVATIVEENVTGVRIVKSFAAEAREITKLSRAAHRLRWATVKQVDIRATYAPLLENLPRVGLVLVLFYGGWQVMNDQLTVGAIFAFSAYVVMLQAPFRVLGFLLMLAERARASAGRIYEILDEPPEVADRSDAVDLTAPRGEVEFRDVTFGYRDGPRVLDGFSFHIRPGESVAIVGRTGSGKSTVARLLMRFYDADSGAVLVDGHDVRDLTTASLRAHIGVVMDDAFLFSTSVRGNIAFGRPDAPLEDVEQAARMAGADGFVEDLPEGYDTLVGERGYTLSGGQRQRVSIARTLLEAPSILVLDDATSSVDVKVEERIHDALRELMRGRTTLVIAHRLSTIQLCDRVVLVDGGRVAADGTHAELMASEPRYREVLAHLEEGTEGSPPGDGDARTSDQEDDPTADERSSRLGPFGTDFEGWS